MSRRWLTVRLAVVLLAAAGAAWLAPARDGEAAGRRFALVVGVKDYENTGLANLKYAENDARDLAEVLREAGYERVVLLTQDFALKEGKRGFFPTAANVRWHLKALLGACGKEDAVLVAFSGHAVRLKGQDRLYLCPEDADLDNPTTLLPLDEIYEALAESKAGVRVLAADVCRNDPRGKAAGDERLGDPARPALPDPPRGVAALFSCSRGQTSYDSDVYKHGFFTHFLIDGLGSKAADKSGEVCLAGLSKYLAEAVPEAVKAQDAARRQVPEALSVEGKAVLVPAGGGKETTNGIGMKLVLVPPGKFIMGSPKEEKGRSDDEGPRHEVEIRQAFYLGKYEVTRGQFGRFVDEENYKTEGEKEGSGASGIDPETGKWVQRKDWTWRSAGFPQTDEHPVVNVSWNDAKAFCLWLSKKEGKEYRLPTEAEWEYACRAGSQTAYAFGDDPEGLAAVDNVADAALKEKFPAVGIEADDGYAFTAPVGRFRPNRFGLHDMHGNVHEWVEDWYGKYGAEREVDPTGPTLGLLYRAFWESGRRVGRGGSWVSTPEDCRAANRSYTQPSNRMNNWGFRVARTAPDRK